MKRAKLPKDCSAPLKHQPSEKGRRCEEVVSIGGKIVNSADEQQANEQHIDVDRHSPAAQTHDQG